MWTRTNCLLLGTGMAGFILLGMALSIFGPVLPVLADRFGLDTPTVGWLLSVFWAGCLAGVGAVYVWPAVLGPRSGLALAAAGAGLLAAMPGWAVVLAGGGVFGAGYGIIAAVYNPRVLAAFGPRGPALMSLMNAVFTLGAIAAPQVFVGLGSDPVLTFAIFAGFACLILLASLPMGNTRTEARLDTAPVRPDWVLFGFVALGIGLESCLAGLGPTALMIAGESPETAAGLLSGFFIAYLISRLSLVVLAQMVPPFALYAGSMTLTAACALGAVIGDPGFWFPFMGFGAGFIFYGGFLTGLRRMGSTTRVSALLLAVGLVGAIVLPMGLAQAMGGLEEKGFFQIILGLSTVLAAVSTILLPRMNRVQSLSSPIPSP